jgi:protein-S-isoprenylcysteine O-methyltransferase Ste14
MAVGLVFVAAAMLFAMIGLVFCGVAAYLSLLPYLEPRWSALAVGGGALALALLVAFIGSLIMKKSIDRLVAWVKSRALVAVAPYLLRFVARHARLVGLASAASAAFFAARSKSAD